MGFGFLAFGFSCFLMIVLPACKLSGFRPLMFSSFRLSFSDLSPELSIVCSKFAFVSCFSLLFAVLFVFWKFQTTVFTRATTVFARATIIFPCQRPFLKLFRLCLLLLMCACPEFFLQLRLRNPKGKCLLGCLCVGRCGLV